VVAHPRHRQIRQDLLVLAEPLETRRAARGRDQVAMRQHGALGGAGRPGRIADDGDVVRGASRQLRVEVAGVIDLELPAELDELGEAREPRLAVAAHPARILVDHVLQVPAARAHAEQLVDLLLVLDDGEPRLGVVDDVLHLALDGVLIDGHRHAAQCLRGHHRPVELRPVVADDCDAVAAREAERGQAERDQSRLLEVLRPRVRLPDPQVLLADRHLVGQAPSVVTDELGKRIALGIERRHAGGVRDFLQIASVAR